MGSSRASTAAAVERRIGPVQVLAHHKHYNPDHDPRWPDPYDTPHATCATAHGDEIVVSVQQKFLWVNGNTGVRVRETAPPFVTDECAMTFAHRGAEEVLVFAGLQAIDHSPHSNLTLVVTREDGTLLSAKSWRSDAHAVTTDMQLVGNRIYFARWDTWRHTEPVHSFDLQSLTEGRTYDVPNYFGLFRDGQELHAIDEQRAAWRLTADAPATRDARPGASLLMQGCPHMQDVLPVAVRDGLSIAIDYGRPGADCDAQEGLNLRDRDGTLLARRPIRDGSWRFASFIIPWNDGIRVVAQRSDRSGFQIWKVPIAF
jgi:hypothetical protein